MKFLSRVRLFGIPWCLPSFSVHGIFQAGVPEWVAISFSRGSSWPRDRTPVSHIAGRCFTLWAINGVCYTLLPEIHNLLMHDIALMKRETEAAWAPPGHTCVAWRPAQAGIHSPAHWHLPNCFWSFPCIPASWTLCLRLCWFTSLFWWSLLSHIFLRKVHGRQCLLKWCMLENAYNISYRFRISCWRSFPKLRRLFFFGFSFFVLEYHTTAFSFLPFYSGSFLRNLFSLLELLGTSL